MNKPWLAFYPEEVPYEITVPSMSIFDLLKGSAESNPEKIAVIDSGREVSYEKLKEMAEKFASSLYENGFRKGSKLAIMLPNCLEYVISYFAVQRLGGIVVQVNPMYQPMELEYLLKNSEAEWIVLNEIQIQKLKAFGYEQSIKIITVDGNDENNIHQWIEKGGDSLPDVSIDDENDIAILQYTGGTTGRSKGVMITHRNVVFNLHQNMLSTVTPPEGSQWEKVMGIAPMFHAMGLTTMVTTIFNGGTYNCIRRFEINSLVEEIRKFKPTMFSGSPTMYIALLNYPGLTSSDLESIRSFSSGSAPLSVEVIKRFEEKTPVPIIEAYGLTEATTMTHKNPSVGTRKVGSIGIPVPNTDCRIVDIETGTKDVPIGETGELIIKGPQVMKGYWKNEEETANAIRDGWLYTGDLATMDEDGFFYIVGRKKDMIIAGGYNIYPLEIEEVIYKMPQVKEVCVYGIPDEYRGETVKAAIVLRENAQLTEQEVEDWCNRHLARYKVPRVIEFMDELPKTAVGKILRTKLIEMEKEKREKSIK